MSGIITAIQHFSIHDGPGIRTTIFFKGCNFHCCWCHNPETISPAVELQVLPELCIGCRACAEHCPAHVHQFEAGGGHTIRRERCRACGICVQGCYAGALGLIGKRVAISVVMEEIEQDRAFYQRSGGGMTLSGGEPFFQADFMLALLQSCQAAGIHTAVETNLAWPWERITAVLPYIDLLMVDVKTVAPDAYRAWVGASNDMVLENLRRLAEAKVDLIIRTPLIAGVNDSREEIARIAEILTKLPRLCYYELLPYHSLGLGKLSSLGREVEGMALAAPTAECILEMARAIARYGIPVRIAGESWSKWSDSR